MTQESYIDNEVLSRVIAPYGYIHRYETFDGIPTTFHLILRPETKKRFGVFPYTSYSRVAQVSQTHQKTLGRTLLEILVLDTKEEENLRQIVGRLRQEYGSRIDVTIHEILRCQ